MVCDNCGSGDAVIHLTQIVNNEMKNLHLCDACAAEKGLEGTDSGANFPLTDFLAQMGNDPGTNPAPGGTRECGFCGMGLDEFRETGRLGCPHCWTTFETHLRGLVRRFHGSTQHVGKVYLSPDPSIPEMEKRLEGLRRKLRRAVDLEDFERAAELRDEIRSLEPAGGA